MPCGAVTLKFCKIDFLGQGNLHNFDICLTEAGLLRKVFKKKFHINAFRFTSVQVSNRDYLRKRSSYDFDIQGDHMNELQLLTLKGRVFSFTVNEPELVANGGKAQVTLRNITSRFDLKGDDAEELYVDKTFNGKFISGLVCKNGDLHMFSDKSERMKNMFHNRTCVNTAIGDDQDTKRLSTTVSVGTKIVDVSISNSHVLIIDIYGRLWAIGTNQWGQLGLGHLMDQSNPTLVSLRSDVARTISISASSSSSIILCEHKDGKICAYFAGKLNDEQIYGYTLCDDSEDEDDLLYHSSQSKVIDRFKMIDVSLPRQTNMVSMTNNQLLFVSRHQVNDNSCFLQLPTRSLTECKDLGINPFRTCSNIDPTWYNQHGNEFNSYVLDRSINWINERISQCECLLGNHVYQTILIKRLTIARQYQRELDEREPTIDEDFDRLYQERLNNIGRLIKSLKLAYSLQNKISPLH